MQTTTLAVMNLTRTSGGTEVMSGDTALWQFSAWYQRIHGYLSLAACTFGSTSNAMNIAVLTRRALISPTNLLLTALAVADLLTMVFYVPYAAYFYCYARPDELGYHPAAWIRYLLFNNGLNITAHTAAMWLTVSLAVFRYVAVCHPTVGSRVCTLRRARIAVAAVVASTVVFCSPNYTMFRVLPVSSGGYWFYTNPFITDEIMNINFWIFGVVLKVLNCFCRVFGLRERSSLSRNSRQFSSFEPFATKTEHTNRAVNVG